MGAACGFAVKPPTLASVVGFSRHIVWMFETYHPMTMREPGNIERCYLACAAKI